MSQIHPYLTFEGNCREAMTFYQECLGGELQLMTFEGTPGADQMPDEKLQLIMHADIRNDMLVLMASDNSGVGPELVNGNTFNLSLNCDTEEEAENYFEALSEGGHTIMPLAVQFWNAKFGILVDKFGFNWMVNHDYGPQEG